MSDPAELRERRYRVINHKSAATALISDSSRFVGFGLMAVYFTLMLSEGPRAEAFRHSYWIPIYLTGLFGVITVALDYLQYVCASYSAKTALDRDDWLYDPKSKAYRLQQVFYRAKQLTAGAGAAAAIFFMALPYGLPVAD